MRLTVSYAEAEVEISFDREGLDHLILSLSRLQNSQAPDHDHLMSEEWGSWELTTTDPDLANVAHHLRLTFVDFEGGRDAIGPRNGVSRDP